MGIAHDSANVYWVFDGHNGNLCRYDFDADHSAGYDDHSNGKIWRYTDVQLSRVPNIPGHMIKDKATGWLYIINTGTKKLMRVNTNTGTIGATLTAPGTALEPLASYKAVTGAQQQVLDSFPTSQPSGVEVYNGRLLVGDYNTGDITVYDITGTNPVKLGVIATGQNGMMGIKVGTDGKIWFVNYLQNTVMRINPAAASANDASVEAITAPVLNNAGGPFFFPGFNICNTGVAPVIELKNNGSATLTSAMILYMLDNGMPSTYSWTGSLAPNASTSVTLPSIAASHGFHKLTVQVTAPNGAVDENTANDAKEGSFRALNPVAPYPFSQSFATAPAGWTFIGHNFHNALTHVATVGNASPGSIRMDNFSGAEDIEGQRDYMITPRIDFSAANANAALSFAVAYAQYGLATNDALAVRVSSDCGQTWTSVYNKAGSALATAPNSTTPFSPAASQWKTETVSLAAYAGQPNVMVQFMTTSGYGNNLYIDDVNISNTTGVEDFDALHYLVYPNPAKDNITIEGLGNTTEEIRVTIYDMVGKVVKQISKDKGTSKFTIDLRDQPTGNYIVKVTSGGHSHQQKISLIR
jgi:hypothetical protein